MKSLIKNFKPLHALYRVIDPRLRLFLFHYFPVWGDRYLYRSVHGRRLNLESPQTFSEKLIWLKLFTDNPLWVTCTDKYAVREYVEQRGFSGILNELYAVYNTVDEIDWAVLPNQFVLKCTHGCGCNLICSDRDKLNESGAREQLESWMHIDYAKFMGEKHYTKIRPRIISEKYLGNAKGDLPADYKIHCFDGKAEIVLVCTERSDDLVLTFLDLDWNIMDIATDRFPPAIDLKRTEQLEQMVLIAEGLARGVPFVRVDFYVFEGDVIFGELTFTPAGGHVAYFSEKGDKQLGDLLKIEAADK